ncbi:MAG TPA: alpha/beta fold hydrolase, partial [Planctomycetota bacterium]|nr:alpha/beta fold hydrolase [Planctomycetota bacterium]
YHYLDEGKGQPVLFVHGNPTWSFYWRELVKDLRATHRCVAPDHVGCGLSDKPGDDAYEYTLERRVEDLSALVDHLRLDKVTLVLHDWGGMIGLAWAAAHPERVSRLVLLNTSGFRLPATKPLPWQLKLVRNLPGFGALSVRGLNAFAGLAVHMAAMKPLDPRVKAGLVAPYDSWRNRIATLRFVQDIPLAPGDRAWDAVMKVEEKLESLRDVPTFIGWGEKDFVFDGHFLDEWRRRLPGAQVKTFPEAGHYVLEDARDELVPLIRDFIAREPSPV